MKLTHYLLIVCVGIAAGIGGYFLYDAVKTEPVPVVPEETTYGGKTKEEIAEEFLRDLEAGIYDDQEITTSTVTE